MVNNSVILLEDNENYAVIDKIPSEKGTYVYLTNIKDTEDFCIRKEIEREEKFFLVGLENEEEVDYAMNLLVRKNLEA